jgi:hypothetical protein
VKSIILVCVSEEIDWVVWQWRTKSFALPAHHKLNVQPMHEGYSNKSHNQRFEKLPK